MKCYRHFKLAIQHEAVTYAAVSSRRRVSARNAASKLPRVHSAANISYHTRTTTSVPIPTRSVHVWLSSSVNLHLLYMNQQLTKWQGVSVCKYQLQK